MKKLINYIFPFILALSPLKAKTLEYIVTDSLSNPLNNSTIVMTGINNPNYLESKNTRESNKASFEVADNEFFFYFVNKLGYENKSATVFSNSDKQIPVNLKPIKQGKWFDYYLNNKDLEMSFLSFDEDVFYKGKDPFNYEIQFTNIGNKIISFDQNGLFSFAEDSLGNKIIGWAEQNPELIYNLNLKEKRGWFKARVEGNDVTIYIGEASGNLDGKNFDITGEGEYVSSKIQTHDNIVPTWLNGKYKINIGLNYNTDKSISLISQDFFIENYIAPIDTTKPKIIIFSPKQDTTYKYLVDKLEYSISDKNLDSCWYSTDLIKTYLPDSAGTINLNSKQGENIWAIYAKDKAGNKSNKRVVFNIDTTSTDTILGIFDKKNLENKILIYPNPFNSHATIQGHNLKVTAYNLLGREVYQGHGNNLIFGENLPAGIYFLNINNKKKKVMKLK